MARLALIVAVALIAAVGVTVGCGYEGQTTATPESVEGSVPEPTETTETTETEPGLEGDAAAGKAIFATNCGGCHTLSDAGTSGTVGPNLDQSQPDAALVVERVTNGAGAMPPFAGTLSEQDIADVAAYVSTAAGG
jgi:mono/diheme cytochrome c family protein